MNPYSFSAGRPPVRLWHCCCWQCCCCCCCSPEPLACAWLALEGPFAEPPPCWTSWYVRIYPFCTLIRASTVKCTPSQGTRRGYFWIEVTTYSTFPRVLSVAIPMGWATLRCLALRFIGKMAKQFSGQFRDRLVCNNNSTLRLFCSGNKELGTLLFNKKMNDCSIFCCCEFNYL